MFRLDPPPGRQGFYSCGNGVLVTFVGTGKVSYNLVAQYNVLWASAPGTPQVEISSATRRE